MAVTAANSKALRLRDAIATALEGVTGVNQVITGNLIGPYDKRTAPYIHVTFLEVDNTGHYAASSRVFPDGLYEIRAYVKDPSDYEAEGDRMAVNIYKALDISFDPFASAVLPQKYQIAPLDDNGWAIVYIPLTAKIYNIFGDPSN